MTRSKILIWCAVPFALLLLAYYFIFDPAATSWAPKCMMLTITGYQCPGCGSQRMMHALMHGDISAAWGFNPFLMCMLPVLALMFFSSLTRLRFPKLYSIVNSLPVIIAIGVALLAWTILRNIF